MTEKEKMLKGLIYDPMDPELYKLRSNAHILSQQYNQTNELQVKEREEILSKLIPNRGKNVYLQGPIQFDYGVNTTIGDNSYANFNFVVLDVCPVKIGKNVFIGPNVAIHTALHPLCYEERNLYLKDEKMTDKEYGASITIEDNCWIAGNVTILPGVTIGKGSVIGAGSVVTRNVPPNSLAFGNPCRVKREITEKDKLINHPELFAKK